MNKEKAEKALLMAMKAYLKTIGWSAMVGSVSRIQSTTNPARFNHELVLRFTGKKLAE
jgi:hypothetical protein